MSKLTIVLCAVLFASVANASSWEDTLKVVHDKVQQVIDVATSSVEEEFLSNQLKTINVAAELADGTTKFGEKIWDEIAAVTQSVTNKINELAEAAKGVCSVDECLKLSDRLSVITKTAISTTSLCINNKLKTGIGYIDKINDVSNEGLVQHVEIKEKAQHCNENISCARSAANAIICAKAAAADATWISIKAAPKLTMGWTKLKFLLITLQRSLGSCVANKHLATFYQESATVVDRTEKCIKEKIEEAHSGNTTPKIQQSSEENDAPVENVENEFFE